MQLFNGQPGSHLPTTDLSCHIRWRCRYNAGTPMGHSMEDKVLKPLLHRKLKDRTLRKPLLVRYLARAFMIAQLRL
jgi:hypothetical protein